MKTLPLLICSLFISLPALAQPGKLIVVEDRGGEPTQPYYEAMGLTEKPGQPVPSPAKAVSPVFQGDAYVLPVRSEKLSPGAVEAVPLHSPGLKPLFLLGDDELSRRWLKERGPLLLEMDAVGMVVAVETPENLQSLREIVPGLVMSPIPGDDLAVRLKIQHYPVLITSTSIEQ